MDSERLLFWNVRGLNERARRDVVADYVSQEKISLLSSGDKVGCN
jgi:hypothetical protein